MNHRLFRIDENKMLFICKPCGIGIKKTKAEYHLKQHFTQESPSEQEYLLQELRKFSAKLADSLNDLNVYPTKELIPLFKDIKVFDGFTSAHDNLVYFSKSEESIQKRFRDGLKIGLPASRAYIQNCKVQQLFKHSPDNLYFGVYDPNQAGLTGEAVGISSDISEIIARLPVPREEQNVSKESIMLSVLNILELKENYDFTITLPQDDDGDFLLYEMIKSSLEMMVDSVQKSMMTVQEKTLLAGGKDVFHFPKTLKKYTSTMMKLVNFLQKSGNIHLEQFDQDDTDECAQSFALVFSKKIVDVLVQKSNIIYDFTLLLGVKSDGTLRTAQMIRNNIPHVLFYIRICAKYLEIKEKQYMPEDWLSFFSSVDPTSSISTLQRLMRYLESFGTEGLEESIFWKRNKENIMDFMEIQIQDVSISLNQLREGVQRVSQEADILIEKLLMDQVILDINLDYADSLRDTKPGTSFESPQLKKLVSNILLNNHWINNFRIGDRWNKQIVSNWIKDCDKLGEILLFLTHLVYGQPARGSELSHMQLLNSKIIQRSLFIVDKQVCLVQGYHKARGVTGQDRYIPRFLDQRSSKQMVIYQGFLRKWQE
jgi:hypothetical protein